MGKFDYDVLVIGGLGHVGLPFGLLLADNGAKVALFDIDTARRRQVQAGKMPFREGGAEALLQRTLGKTLHLVDSLEAAARSQTLIITVGTPLDEYMNPRLLPLIELVEELSPYLRHDQLVVLRSTVYPGTTDRISELLAKAKARADLAYCPERVAQGRAIEEIRKLPQLVAGASRNGQSRAESLFARLGVRTIPLTVREAELAKLFLNAWRYLQFATANQFYMMAVEHGADPHRIHHAMTDGYDRAVGLPRPGFAAGPCLLKDTLQLAAFNKNVFALGHAAMQINEGLPGFLVESLEQHLGRPLSGETVGILGMAFKADIDDTRDSLSFKLLKLLRFKGAKVLCSDEHAVGEGFVSKEELVAQAHVVIVGVPHAAYKELSIPAGVTVVDLWNFVGPKGTPPSAGLVKVGGRRGKAR